MHASAAAGAAAADADAAAAVYVARSVHFPNKNPIFYAFFVSDYAHSGSTSVMTNFRTEIVVNKN